MQLTNKSEKQFCAEDAGVDIVYNWDHFFPLYGEPEGAH